MIFNKRFLKDFDKALFLSVVVIILFGLLAVYSATQAKGLPFSKSFVLKQLTSLAVAAALFLIVVNIPYQKWIDAGSVFYGINVALLVLVLILGHARLGAQRWFSIGSFAFQPSEFIKINIILVLAGYIGAKKDRMSGLRDLLVPIVLLGVPFALVLLQPDLGTALLLVPVFFAMLMIGGAKMRYIAGMAGLGFAALPFFWHFLRGYQKQRLLVFLDPNIDPLGAGYTIIQSKIAVGSGGLFGKGWLAGTQNQLNFLPERHTDFIFSVVGEEWGFLGAAALVLLYLLIVRRMFGIVSATTDIYGRLIATGVLTLLSLQVIINIGMTIGLMPVVGIPLPLVSYGGTSLIATLVAIGLVLNVGMRR